MKHLLVTNDFPPKIGGIQSLLWEWWRRLPPDRFAVLTSPYRGARRFDAEQPFRVERTPEPVLLPHPRMARRIDDWHGRSAPSWSCSTRPCRSGWSARRSPAVRRRAARRRGDRPRAAYRAAAKRWPTCCGGPATSCRRASTPPAKPSARRAGRCPSRSCRPGSTSTASSRSTTSRAERHGRSSGCRPTRRSCVSISRLVPRKGFDVAIEAAAALAPTHPDLVARHLRRRAATSVACAGWPPSTRAPVRVPRARSPMTSSRALYGCADVFAMACRTRWGGLEQEGFGIVFVEAAACGVPQVAGESGGAAEAVVDGVTGIVVRRPEDPVAVAAAFETLLADPSLRTKMGVASRERALTEFSYDVLARRLGKALEVGDG